MQLSKDPVAVSRKACSLQGRIRSMEGLVASENILVEGDDNSCAVKLANMMNKDSNGKMMSPESMDDLFEMFGNQKTCEKTLEEGLVLVQRTGRNVFFKGRGKIREYWYKIRNKVKNAKKDPSSDFPKKGIVVKQPHKEWNKISINKKNPSRDFPNCVGMSGEQAKKMIQNIDSSLHVVIVTRGSNSIAVIISDRVRIYVNKFGIVVKQPRTG